MWFKDGPLKKVWRCSTLGAERTDVGDRQLSRASDTHHKGSVVRDWSQPSRNMPDQGEDYMAFELDRTCCPGWVNQHWCSETCQGVCWHYKSVKGDHKIRPRTPKSSTFFYGRAVLGCDHNGVLTCFMVYAGIFFILLARVGSCLYR